MAPPRCHYLSYRWRHWYCRYVESLFRITRLGWLTSPRLPRMIIVQAEGCAPLVRAFHRGLDAAETWPAQEAHTKAAGLCVPSAIGDRLILQALRESGGTALTVSDDALTKMVYYTS